MERRALTAKDPHSNQLIVCRHEIICLLNGKEQGINSNLSSSQFQSRLVSQFEVNGRLLFLQDGHLIAAMALRENRG
jgi:hypothetical protein